MLRFNTLLEVMGRVFLFLKGGTDMNTIEIQALLDKKEYGLVKQRLLQEQAVDISEFVDDLDPKVSLLIFRLLPKELAVDVFSYLSPESQTELSSLVNEDELQEIVDELFFDDKIDFLEEVPASVVKRILLNAPESERRLINQFLAYPEDSAGSVMTIEFVSLKKEMTVEDALTRIRKTAPEKETIYTCYVTDGQRRLEGIITLKDLVLSKLTDKVGDIMSSDIISITTQDEQEEAADLFKKYNLLALPVTDHENRLVGIITVDDIMDVVDEEATEDIHKMATVGDLNTSILNARPWLLIKKRAPWLLVLIIVNVFSGAGIAYFEEMIQSVVALVFFLPLLIDSAGNAGSQSATLMIRAMTLGDVQINDWFKLFIKEFMVGIPIGLLMAVTVSFVGFYRGGMDVAVIVSLSMFIVVVMGSVVGMCLPFIFNRLKMDPATASGPLITSIADILGVLIYFSIASWYLGF